MSGGRKNIPIKPGELSILGAWVDINDDGTATVSFPRHSEQVVKVERTSEKCWYAHDASRVLPQVFYKKKELVRYLGKIPQTEMKLDA